MITLALTSVFALYLGMRWFFRKLDGVEEERYVRLAEHLRRELAARDARIVALEQVAMESGRRLVCTTCGQADCEHWGARRWLLVGAPYRHAGPAIDLEAPPRRRAPELPAPAGPPREGLG